jgi:hypothetical protein
MGERAEHTLGQLLVAERVGAGRRLAHPHGDDALGREHGHDLVVQPEEPERVARRARFELAVRDRPLTDAGRGRGRRRDGALVVDPDQRRPV